METSGGFPSLQRPLTTNATTCEQEYRRVTASRTPGLTVEDLEHSRAYMGNRYRLGLFTEKLKARKKVNVIVCGGSITLGHGITPQTDRYSDQLEVWLNGMYPTSSKHKVLNYGSHGADMCAMAKRINQMDLPDNPDMFILEFAVNDYQGQDHKIHVDHKTDVFFQGFQNLALCAETVVHKLLTDFPKAAIVFLEFQTAILNRKTAQMLHMGVAQHYQVPVISYADALFPDLYRLVEMLKPYDYSIPPDMKREDVLPFPHGCGECRLEHILKVFRHGGCKSVCTFMSRSGYYHGECDTKREPCYPPFFAHDAVHPSNLGHAIARDLIAEAIAQASRQLCEGRTFSHDHLPFHSGWLAAGLYYHDKLRALSDFDLVQDTMDMFGQKESLQSKDHSEGFALTAGEGLADRIGWVASNPAGGEYVVYEINLPESSCYAVFVSVIKSYETFGSFAATVEDLKTGSTTPSKEYDCLWEPRISIPTDIQLTADGSNECMGHCRIKIQTLPEIEGRKGNKMKVTSLAVRKCIVVD